MGSVAGRRSRDVTPARLIIVDWLAVRTTSGGLNWRFAQGWVARAGWARLRLAAGSRWCEVLAVNVIGPGSGAALVSTLGIQRAACRGT